MFASSRLIALCTPNCKSLWIKASAKWLNVNVNVNVTGQRNGNHFRSEGYRNVKCSNNNKYYNIYVCIIDKTIISFFNWLRNQIYCCTIITSYGHDCTISIYTTNTFIFINFFHRIRQKIYVTLDHKSSLKSLGYIYSNSQQYSIWVTMIDLSFMPKIIRILSKDHILNRKYIKT